MIIISKAAAAADRKRPEGMEAYFEFGLGSLLLLQGGLAAE